MPEKVTDEMRKQFKKENPYYFSYLLGKYPSDSHILDYFNIKNSMGNIVGKAANAGDSALSITRDAASSAANVISDSFDIVSWIKQNWRLSILGLVAIWVLLRD